MSRIMFERKCGWPHNFNISSFNKHYRTFRNLHHNVMSTTTKIQIDLRKKCIGTWREDHLPEQAKYSRGCFDVRVMKLFISNYSLNMINNTSFKIIFHQNIVCCQFQPCLFFSRPRVLSSVNILLLLKHQ